VWDAPAILGIGLAVLALVVTLALRWWDGRREKKRGAIRAELAGQIAPGLALLQEVKGAGEEIPPDLAERVDAWDERTLAILDRAGPQYRPLFTNHVGYVFYGGTRYGNALNGRLRRLTEFVGKV
jgi:hypothetical protein